MNRSTHRPTAAGARLTALLLGLLLLAVTSFAHDPGLSYLELRPHDGQLEVRVTFARADWMKLSAIRVLDVEVAGHAIAARDVHVESDQSNAVHFHASYPVADGGAMHVRSLLIAQLSHGHRQFLTIRDTAGEIVKQEMLDANSDSFDVTTTAAAKSAPTFANFLKLGLEHIFTGYDHLVFLFGLLIVGGSLRSAIKIITSFTIAHSISLALATLNLVSLPGKIVEPLIAASITYVGIENFFRRDLDRRWMLTFGFGLVHGLGFASALRDLGVGTDGAGVVMPLLSFNLGVELGQLSIAAVGLPLIWKLSKLPRFETAYVPACSGLVTVAGLGWLIQRVWFG